MDNEKALTRSDIENHIPWQVVETIENLNQFAPFDGLDAIDKDVFLTDIINNFKLIRKRHRLSVNAQKHLLKLKHITAEEDRLDSIINQKREESSLYKK